jgi:multicomponent Na+:H+ antiporter subunit B
MSSIILRTAARGLQPVLLLFSIFLLAAGHNEPGGGFVAGLVAAAAVALYAIAYDVETARRVMPLEPQTLIGCGLLLALGSGVWPLLLGESFMTGQWTSLPDRDTDGFAVGTPLLFDLGVFLLVVGVTLLLILSIAED